MTEHSDPHPGEPSEGTVELAHQLLDWAREGQAERVAAYVDAGAPVDLAGPDGNTLLMLAAYHGHAALVRALAERGADVNRLNDRGQAPVAGAVFKGEADVVDALLEHGADLDAGHPTARETAAMFERTDLLPPSRPADP
ncbi:ankyrin repeat domain-containing protein [Janibacter sp. G368]|uniref:ankyrin repeat domain-containing protein n=1 Tax=Janibacter sp. G368 TaxID=3420441 RepID=UPI003D04E9E8